MRNPLDHPVVDYLVNILCSLLVAIICFELGGSLAKVSGNEESVLGLTFEASGALAGFIIVFLLSKKALERLRSNAAARRELSTVRVKVYVLSKGFDRKTRYQCEASLQNETTGATRTAQVTPRWEAGYLTLLFPDVLLAEFVGAVITDDLNHQWQLEDFQPFTHKQNVIPLFKSNGNGGGGGSNSVAKA